MTVHDPDAVYLQKTLSSILEDREYGNVFAALSSSDEAFSRVDRERFFMEHLAAKLALGSRVWEQAVAELKPGDRDREKKFFQRIMQSFQSPRMMDVASAFSDYLLGSGDDNESLAIAYVLKMHTRLGLQENIHSGAGPFRMTPSFQLLTEILEGFRVHWENEFHARLLEHPAS